MRNNTNITHVVLDVETLGTVASMLKKGTCPILQTAYTIVKYYPEDSQWRLMGGAGFTFSLGNQHENHACQETVAWHIEHNRDNYISQSKASVEAHLDSADEFRKALEEIASGASEVHYWARGKDFDFPILTSYAMQNNFTYPFMRDYAFSRIHCIRDLEKFFGIDGKQYANTNPHNAFDDAVQEAKVLCHWLNHKECNHAFDNWEALDYTRQWLDKHPGHYRKEPYRSWIRCCEHCSKAEFAIVEIGEDLPEHLKD